MCEENLFYIKDTEANQRLDIFLTLKFKEKNISRSQIKNLIEKNNVFVNGKKIKAGYVIKKNDEIKIKFAKNMKKAMT